MKRNDLLNSPEYWTSILQMELYRQIEDFMKEHDMNKTKLAEYLGCSKGYVTQLLSGDYDHKMSKFMALCLAIGKIPEFQFVSIDKYIEEDSASYSTSTTNNIYVVPCTKDGNDFINVA